jgi:hypothetical protein
MTEAMITQFISETFDGVDIVVGSKEAGSPEIAWGDTFYFYDPTRSVAADRRMPFATIVTKDYGEFDNASNLNRPGVFRLNIGIGKEPFTTLFGASANPDFTELDRLMPHPVYGKMFWVSVLNPSATTFEAVRPLLAEAHQIAVKTYERAQPAALRKQSANQ